MATEWDTAKFDAAMAKMVANAPKVAEAALREAAQLGVVDMRADVHSKSGKLAGSIMATDPVVKGLGGYEVKIGPTGLPYARKVELGKHGDRSAGPYPYVVPGFKRAVPKFIDVFRKHWATIHKG